MFLKQILKYFQLLLKVGELTLDKVHQAMNDPEYFSKVTTDRLGLTFKTIQKFQKLEDSAAIYQQNKYLNSCSKKFMFKLSKG